MSEQPAHRQALPEGTRLQEFELRRFLGAGGFGIAYLGWNAELNIPVAIKEYLPSDCAIRERSLSVAPRSEADEDVFEWGLDRFLEEARVLARFRHRSIVQIYRFFRAHGTGYIAMEYVEGQTLSEWLKDREPLSEAEVRGILLPLLDGLEEVHRAGVMHRDIKPGNIMLRDEDGSPVLLDFGAARQTLMAKSRSVTAVLTPGYAPVEQYSEKGKQGPWTDIYALGALCHRMLAGEVPEEASNRILEDTLEPLEEACRGRGSPEFLRAVDWALRVRQKDRPQSLGEWRTALDGGRAPEKERSQQPPLSQRLERNRHQMRQRSGRLTFMLPALLWLPCSMIFLDAITFADESILSFSVIVAAWAFLGLPLALVCRELWRKGYLEWAWVIFIVLGMILTNNWEWQPAIGLFLWLIYAFSRYRAKRKR